jgi:hypothetical protein
MPRLNSKYSVLPIAQHGADCLVILESRGGSLTGKSARNPDYAKQLSRILRVLKSNFCQIRRIEVLSTAAYRTGSPRKLKLTYPIKLSQVQSIEELRKEIQAAQRTVSQRQGASGGNSTKRIGIWVKAGPLVPSIGLKTLISAI